MDNIYRLAELEKTENRVRKHRETHPILNHIYDILAKLHNQGKKITQCKDFAHIGIKGNEVADKAAKQATDMLWITTTRLRHTDYYLAIRRTRNSESFMSLTLGKFTNS